MLLWFPYSGCIIYLACQSAGKESDAPVARAPDKEDNAGAWADVAEEPLRLLSDAGERAMQLRNDMALGDSSFD